MAVAVLIFEINFLRTLQNENWINFLSPLFKKDEFRTGVVWVVRLMGKP